jgi:hypothetical protein
VFHQPRIRLLLDEATNNGGAVRRKAAVSSLKISQWDFGGALRFARTYCHPEDVAAQRGRVDEFAVGRPADRQRERVGR